MISHRPGRCDEGTSALAVIIGELVGLLSAYVWGMADASFESLLERL